MFPTMYQRVSRAILWDSRNGIWIGCRMRIVYFILSKATQIELWNFGNLLSSTWRIFWKKKFWRFANLSTVTSSENIKNKMQLNWSYDPPLENSKSTLIFRNKIRQIEFKNSKSNSKHRNLIGKIEFYFNFFGLRFQTWPWPWNWL